MALLWAYGGKLGKTDIQKLVLIFTKEQKEPVYHFIPYNYGCYSYRINQDLLTLQKYKKTLEENNHWLLLDKKDHTTELTEADRNILFKIKSDFRNITGNKLIRFTYINFPYYAIKSKIAYELLSDTEIKNINKFKPVIKLQALYTIGYEGISLEEYLNKLIINDIKVLCDVRKNAISMKYGFSKNQLKTACENLEIKYIHMPMLGIESSLRNVEFADDRKALFKQYRETTLKSNIEDQNIINDLVHKYSRVALTCFEADLSCCHRLHLAENILKNKNISFACIHL